jgi:hypothetical protein
MTELDSLVSSPSNAIPADPCKLSEFAMPLAVQFHHVSIRVGDNIVGGRAS